MTSIFDGLPDIFLGTFGQAVSIYPTDEQVIETTGIFRNQAVDDLGVIQPGATLHLRASDATTMQDGDYIQIGDAWFRARPQSPDGKGMVPVHLEASGPLESEAD